MLAEGKGAHWKSFPFLSMLPTDLHFLSFFCFFLMALSVWTYKVISQNMIISALWDGEAGEL